MRGACLPFPRPCSTRLTRTIMALSAAKSARACLSSLPLCLTIRASLALQVLPIAARAAGAAFVGEVAAQSVRLCVGQRYSRMRSLGQVLHTGSVMQISTTMVSCRGTKLGFCRFVILVVTAHPVCCCAQLRNSGNSASS